MSRLATRVMRAAGRVGFVIGVTKPSASNTGRSARLGTY